MNDITPLQPGVHPDEKTSPKLDVSLVKHILALVEAGQRGSVFVLVGDLHPADVALLLTRMPFGAARKLFQWLPVKQAGETLAELDDEFRAQMLKAVVPASIKAMIDEMETDDAADVLADLPEDVVERIIPELQHAEEVKELLDYDEETAGGIMTTKYAAAPITATVAQATEVVRQQAEKVDRIYTLFVVDTQGRLCGKASLQDLLLASDDARLGQIMDVNVRSVTPDVDQEEVSRIVERYDLLALPVVDGNGRLLGRITIDDVVDVIREEAEEDIQRMSGLTGGVEPTDSVSRIVRGRLPWLLVGMIGSVLGALVIMQFEEALEEAAVLAAFIPLVAATAGNAGIQSSAVAVQGLASGSIWKSDILTRLGKEFAVAVLNGLGAALLVALFVLAIETVSPGSLDRAFHLTLTIGVALIAVIMVATVIGATMPLLLDHIGIDPAVSTGPFITVSNDILGIFIYFVSASFIYLNA
jgi:magnesium transporter